MKNLSCFNHIDIRGRVGENFDESIVYQIGRAFTQHVDAKTIAVGADCRLSSPALKKALVAGIQDQGCSVLDLGVCGTEEVYFATFFLNLDGGIQVTASHNPKNYNGLKFVGKNATSITETSGLDMIKELAQAQTFSHVKQRGTQQATNCQKDYLDHLFSIVDPDSIPPLKVVVNSGNGVAGISIDAIVEKLKRRKINLNLIRLNHTPDGNFPQGVPNPLLHTNRHQTAQAVIEHQADLGVAWDGDNDRCFFFDETGTFVEGYYVVGLVAANLLEPNPGGIILYDPRLTWNTIDQVKMAGGKAVCCRTGHAYFKEAMRKHQAIYGGELSSHHYFRDFAFCDSGILPWLLMMRIMGQSQSRLSQLIHHRKELYPCSGELNFKNVNTNDVFDMVQNATLASDSPTESSNIDGLSICFKDWRFNLRRSNTEPLVRLNIETRSNLDLLEQKILELSTLIKQSTSLNGRAKHTF